MASATTDVDMTSKSQTGSASRDYDMTQILAESRSVRVVLYGSTPVESEHRFWIDSEVTFGGVAKALDKMYPSQEVVVLQAIWGPRPYWTKSHPDSSVGGTCRVLYAILKDQAKPYTMGVVRTSLSDYPIPIYVPKSPTSLLEAVIASYPKLTGQIRSITLPFGGYDLQDDSWDDRAQSQPYPAAPLLITTLDEPSKEFLAGSLYEAFSPLSPKASTSSESDGLIPPLLQISFAECKLLVQRAYDLDAFPLQMIHLSEAIFHVVISLARSLTPVFESNSSSIGDALSAEDDLADHLRVAPLHCQQLEELLDAANGIMDNLELGGFNRNGTQHAIEKIFATLCGDLPGAVTVRCSEKDFKKFGGIDCQELDTLPIDTHTRNVRTAYPESITEDTDLDPMMDLDYYKDVGNLSDMDWLPPSGMEGRSEAASTLRHPNYNYNSMALIHLSLPPGSHPPDPDVMGPGKAGQGICIVSFDGGGPGSLSQLRMLHEMMLRLACDQGVKVGELRPVDYFDLMGGVGFGGLVALLLGRLRMTTSQAVEELLTVGIAAFSNSDGLVTLARLRNAIENMLERHGHPVDIQLHDSSENRCKVVLFAAPTLARDRCHPFRTYQSITEESKYTFVDVACATMANPEYFSPVATCPSVGEEGFAGIPHGFDDPMREVLKESQRVFGEKSPVSLVLSLGSGHRARPSHSDQLVTRLSGSYYDGVARDLQPQLRDFVEYIRLNVDNGVENIVPDDWSNLGSIEAYTEMYLNLVTRYIDTACRCLIERNGSVTLGQLSTPPSLSRYFSAISKSDVLLLSGGTSSTDSLAPSPSHHNTEETRIDPPRVKHTDSNEQAIKAQERHIQSMIRHYCGDSEETQIRALELILKYPGKVCRIERRKRAGAPSGGVQSLVCLLCPPASDVQTARFEKANAVRTFAEHLTHMHLQIPNPFVCFATACGKVFPYSQDRDRHEKQIHKMYRPKAYQALLKNRVREQSSMPPVRTDNPQSLTEFLEYVGPAQANPHPATAPGTHPHHSILPSSKRPTARSRSPKVDSGAILVHKQPWDDEHGEQQW